MVKKEKKRILSIDILKIVAIALIILFHVLYAIYQKNYLRPIGFVGVSLFFILSGYTLAKNYPSQTTFSLRWFLKRLVKVASLYYLAIISIVVLFGNQTYSGNIKDILLHFIFLDPLSKSAAYSIISPAWFLTPLIGLYLIFPYLNKYVKETKFLIVAFFLMVIFRTLSGNDIYTSYSPLFFLGEFCFGIAFAYNKKHSPLIISLMLLFINPIMIIPFVVFYLTYHMKFEGTYVPTKLIHFIGINTFSLFLFHEAFIKVSLKEWNIYNLSMPIAIIILILTTVLTAFLAHKIKEYLNKKIENPKRKNSHD
jgi:peptidoglycan/LPS O-acetylase OafA/YrhL